MKSAHLGRTIVGGHGLDHRKDCSTLVGHESRAPLINIYQCGEKSHRGFKSPTLEHFLEMFERTNFVDTGTFCRWQ